MFGSDYVQDPSIYILIVGALQYATNVRQEISHSLGMPVIISAPLQSLEYSQADSWILPKHDQLWVTFSTRF